MPEEAEPRRPDGSRLSRTEVADVVALGPDLRPGAGQTGTDDAGVVLVRVTAEGTVSAVEIDRRWGSRLAGVDALAAAVLTAYRQALLKRMAARLVNGPAPAAVARAEDPPGAGNDRWLDGVRDALDRVYRHLVDVERSAPGDHEITGPGRCARVRVAGGAAGELVVDLPRTATQAPDLVADDTRPSLDRASRD